MGTMNTDGFSFVDSNDNTKKITFQTSGATTSTALTLASIATTNRTATFPDATDTIVARSTTDTLANKSFNNNSCFHTDNTDSTKKIGFSSSAATTATTLTLASTATNNRTLTLPDATDTIVARSTTDTLLNKSLSNNTCAFVDTSDATKKINFSSSGATTATTLTLASVATTGRTVTLPDATDTLVARATTDTLTNKSFNNSSCFFTDNADNTKKVGFSSSGATTATTTTLAATSTTTRTLTLPDVTDTMVARTTTDTLSNKTLLNNTCAFADNTDNTKKVAFSSSGSSTATTTTLAATSTTNRTLTLPDVTDTMVARTTTDTLSNKTLLNNTCAFADNTDNTKKVSFSSSSSTTATTLTLAAATTANRTLTMPDATDTIVARTTTDTLSNKTLSNNTCAFADNTDSTKKVNFSSSGATTATTTTIVCSQTANRNVTLPNATTTLVGNDTTQTLTNKTITGTTNTVDASGIRSATTTVSVSGATAPTSGQVLTATSSTAATWQTPSTGGTPGGSDTQVQYNNSGAFGGAAKTSIDNTDGTIYLSDFVTDPSGVSGASKLYSKTRASRSMAHGIGGIGSGYTFQPHLGIKYYMAYYPVGNGANVTTIRFSNTNFGGTTNLNVATTGLLASSCRLGNSTGAGANNSAGTRHNLQQFWLGNAAGLGGFHFICRFGIETSIASNPTQRIFIGMIASTAAIANNVNPSSLTNILGFGYDSGDSTWSFIHNDSIGTATKDALSASFSLGDNTSVFEARIFAPPNASIVYYSLEDLVAGTLTDSSATTDLPSSTTFLAPQIWINNGSSGGTAIVDVISLYIEKDV